MREFIVRSTSVIAFVFAVIMLVGYVQHKRDPYSRYRDVKKEPVSIKPVSLKNFWEEEQLIRAKLALDLSSRERAILSGIHWIISFVDDDENFMGLFPDFMLLMNRMTISEDRIHQKEVAELIVKNSFSRAEKKLSDIFDTDEKSRWNFIRLFNMLINYPQFNDSYFRFYHKQFGSRSGLSFKDEKMSFSQAIKEADYQMIFAYLLQTSFLHFYLAKAKNPPVELPPDDFPRYLKEFENFNYNLDLLGPPFRDQGYLVTHIFLFLTSYGEFDIDDGINISKAKTYIESTFDKVKQFGDFDLFAEYILCLKMIKNRDNARIKDLEEFILDLQHSDGSWGSEWDFNTNPYTAIHPTGAALFTLNQSN